MDFLALGDLELADSAAVLAVGLDLGPESEHVGSGDRPKMSLVAATDPRDLRAVIESDDEFHPHRHPTAAPLDDPDQVGRDVPGRHAVDHRDLARVGLEDRLQDQGIAAISPLDFTDRLGGGDQPSAVFRPA